MTFRQALKKSAYCCLAGLLVGGYASSLIFNFWLRFDEGAALIEWFKAPFLAFSFLAMLAGLSAVPILLFAWPAYAWLLFRQRANYFTVLLIPLFLSLVALIWVHEFVAIMVASFGAFIAIATHAASRVGPNNSFKPSPLRGLGQNPPFSGGPA